MSSSVFPSSVFPSPDSAARFGVSPVTGSQILDFRVLMSWVGHSLEPYGYNVPPTSAQNVHKMSPRPSCVLLHNGCATTWPRPLVRAFTTLEEHIRNSEDVLNCSWLLNGNDVTPYNVKYACVQLSV